MKVGSKQSNARETAIAERDVGWRTISKRNDETRLRREKKNLGEGETGRPTNFRAMETSAVRGRERAAGASLALE